MPRQIRVGILVRIDKVGEPPGEIVHVHCVCVEVKHWAYADWLRTRALAVETLRLRSYIPETRALMSFILSAQLRNFDADRARSIRKHEVQRFVRNRLAFGEDRRRTTRLAQIAQFN